MLALYQQAAVTCPGAAMDDPGSHRDHRVRQRAVGPSGSAQRRQRGQGRKGRCSSSRGPLRPTTSRCLPAERPRRVPTIRRTPLLRRPVCLCADGAAGGADLSGAVYAYNHSASYVAEVLALAQTYASSPAAPADTGSSGSAGAVAVSWALSQIGTPTSGEARHPVWASTVRDSSRPPTPWRAFHFPEWRRTSTTRRRSWLPGPSWPRETWCSSAAGRIHRPRRPLRGCGQWRERHGRCTAHRCRRTGRGLSCEPGIVFWQLAVCRGDEAGVSWREALRRESQGVHGCHRNR